jgi:hypothetical protein
VWRRQDAARELRLLRLIANAAHPNEGTAKYVDELTGQATGIRPEQRILNAKADVGGMEMFRAAMGG